MGGPTGGTRGGAPAGQTRPAQADEEAERETRQNQVGRVFVRGTPEQIEEIRRLIAENDRLPREVLLETYLLDVNVTRADNAGISFDSFFGTARQFNGSPLGAYQFNNQLDQSNQLIRFGALSTERFQLFLNFLKNFTDTRILNRPSALVLDGGTATLNLGGQLNFLRGIQITTTSLGAIVQSPLTEALNTGQNLVLTPRIMPNDIILLNVTIDDTAFVRFNSFGQGVNQINLPETTRRALVAPMFLKNGSAAIIGGLKNSTTTRESAKVPLLGQLPFIGRNFGRNLKSLSSKELVLVIKATVYAPEDF